MKNIIKEASIKIPPQINIKFDKGYYIFNGKNGEIKHELNKHLSLKIEKEKAIILLNNENKQQQQKKFIKKNSSLINTTLALFKNYFYGIQYLYEKILILKGIGYKAEVKNNILKLHIGFSNPIDICIPNNIKVDINSSTNVIIKGISKAAVGQFAANVKFKRKSEPYKGNGIRYKNEIIKLKSPKKSK